LKRPLLFVWQLAALCEKLPALQLKQLDYNIYVHTSDGKNIPPILWSPASNEKCQKAFESLETFREIYPEFSKNSRYLINYGGQMFKSIELKNYQLLPEFIGTKSGMQLPKEIGKLINNYDKEKPYIGAYRPMK
jgi:hypothetical protein